MNKITRRQFLTACGVAGAAGMLTACGGKSNSTAGGSGEMPKVVITYNLPNIPADNQKVSDALSAYTEQKIGVKVELAPIVSSDYKNQLNLIISSPTEHYDIAYCTDLTTFATKGAVIDMTDLMEEYGQEMKAQMGKYIDACVIDGRLYGLSPIKNMASQYGYMIRKDLVEKYNLDFSGVTKEEDLTPIFAELKKHEPNMTMVAAESNGNPFLNDRSVWDALGDNMGVLMDMGQNLNVVNLFETDFYEQQCRLHRDWYLKGYIPADIATASEASQDMIRVGMLAGYTCTLKAGIEQEKKAKTGYDMITVPLGKVFTASNLLAKCWTILNNSPNPEAAAKVMNLMYSDETFLNLWHWGIEGEHYQKTDKGTITFVDGQDAKSCGYYHAMNWQLGNQLITYVAEPETADLWDRMKAWNDTSTLSKAFGFIYDSTPVKNQYSACKNVYDKYAVAITNGTLDVDENLPKFISEIKAAGIDEIIAEKQAQLDAWAKANGVS